MPQIKQIIEKEHVRNSKDSARTVHLYKEGNFYRAYEWSAWLLSLDTGRLLKPTHREMKCFKDTIIFIGFPVNSLEKYSPAENNCEKKVVDNGCVDICLNDSYVFSLLPDITDGDDDNYVRTMQGLFSEWKNSIPVTKEQKKERSLRESLPFEGNAAKQPTSTITGVMHDILSFSIENHTPMECVAFIGDVKASLAKII